MGWYDDGGLPDAAFTEDELAAGVQHLARGDDRSYFDDEYEAQEPVTFVTFQKAIAWAKNNPGRAIIRSQDGSGFVIKE